MAGDCSGQKGYVRTGQGTAIESKKLCIQRHRILTDKTAAKLPIPLDSWFRMYSGRDMGGLAHDNCERPHRWRHRRPHLGIRRRDFRVCLRLPVCRGDGLNGTDLGWPIPLVRFDNLEIVFSTSVKQADVLLFQGQRVRSATSTKVP